MTHISCFSLTYILLLFHVVAEHRIVNFPLFVASYIKHKDECIQSIRAQSVSTNASASVLSFCANVSAIFYTPDDLLHSLVSQAPCSRYCNISINIISRAYYVSQRNLRDITAPLRRIAWHPPLRRSSQVARVLRLLVGLLPLDGALLLMVRRFRKNAQYRH